MALRVKGFVPLEVAICLLETRLGAVPNRAKIARVNLRNDVAGIDVLALDYVQLYQRALYLKRQVNTMGRPHSAGKLSDCAATAPADDNGFYRADGRL